MSDEYHALASPSSAHRWMNCANALAMEIGQPQGDTKAADLGSDKHELMALCLEFGKNAIDYEGHVLKRGHTVDKTLAADVQTVVDNIRDRIRGYLLQGCKVQVEIEQDVPIDHMTGEEGATGRADVILLINWPAGHATMDVIDAKFGYQEVESEDNPQLMMYGSGAIEKFALVEDFVSLNLVIEQPLRTGNEWSISTEKLLEWADTVKPKAQKALMIHKMAGERALKEEDFSPSENTCQWCKAKAVCPALLAKVEEGFGAKVDDYADEQEAEFLAQAISVERLGEIFPNLELIEDWIKAVRARIEVEVFAGREVPGVKVVAGKRGNRAWAREEEAEQMMKSFKMKVDQMYAFKLLGPKPILEALKDQPRRLKKIEQLIVQPEGKPHVVAVSDKRPAIEIKPVESGFDELC